MAGAGYKLFATGDVLTAAQVNTYLQEQTVMVFANAAARTTALSGVLAEGMITYLKDTDAVEKYDGSAWSSVAGASSPLTTKGDLYTYSTTNARLAVGNNGETLVADSAATTGLRWQGNFAAGKNALINGDFGIWQRGTSIANTSAAANYTADRWFIYSGTANKTVTRQTTSDATNLPFIQYCARVQRNSGNTALDSIIYAQSIETSASIPMVGRTVTLSFYARKGSNFSSSSDILNMALNTGTGTDQNNVTSFTGFATPLSQNVTLTTTWQRFSASVSIPTTANEIGIRLTYTPTGTAGTNDYFEVTGVQLEIGSVATAFETATGTLAGELAACQRYYFRQGGQALYQRVANGAFQGTTTAYIQMPHPVSMRKDPTVVDFSTMALNDYASTIAATNVTIDYAGASMTSLAVTVASGGTQFRPVQFVTNNSTSGYVGLSAEL